MIESFDPAYSAIVPRRATCEPVADGFRFLEGPVWHPDGERLLFSDIPGNGLYTFRADEGVRLWRRNSYLANGNTLDLEGNLLTCEHGTSRVSRTRNVAGFTAHGSYEVIASHFENRELNSPNDIVVRSDGSIWFTDPTSGRSERFGIPREPQLPFSGVYRVDPNSSAVRCVVDDFEFPNGLCFSPDESHLYVNDSRRQHVRRFPVASDGTLGAGIVVCQLEVVGPGVADGMKFDSGGNLFVSGPGGIHIFAPWDGSGHRLIGRLRTSEVAANFTWGGTDLTELYLAATTTLYHVQLAVPGRGAVTRPVGSG